MTAAETATTETAPPPPPPQQQQQQQTGVLKAKAISRTWTRRSLWIAYAG